MLNFINILLAFPTVQVKGRGRPVLFSTGLCNTMPSYGYSLLLKSLRKNLTVITYDGLSVLDDDTINKISNVYFKGSKFGYMGHSSLFPSILNHEKIDKIVLLDPACFPNYFDIHEKKFVSKILNYKKDCLVINADYTKNNKFPFIPEGFELRIKNIKPIEYQGVGHADILDDIFALPLHLLGIKGVDDLKNARRIRNEYRNKVSSISTDFFN